MRHSQSAAVHPINAGDDERAPAQGIEDRRLRLMASEPVSQSGRAGSSPAPSIWEPVPVGASRVPTTSAVLNLKQPSTPIPADVESAIIGTILRPLAPGEGHERGNQAKEQELSAALAKLNPAQSHYLVRRLETDRADDPLCQAFRRLLLERRERLKVFLRNAHRRHVVRG
jgi:hypothetical protein